MLSLLVGHVDVRLMMWIRRMRRRLGAIDLPYVKILLTIVRRIRVVKH